MSRQPNDLVVTIIIATVSGALILLVPAPNVLRLVATLPLLFILPGYAIMSALLPKGSRGVSEQILFSMGLSLTIVIIGGFALHWTPWGLQAGSWVGLLFGVTLTASLVAMKRWRRAQSVAGLSLDVGIKGRQGLLLGLAVLVTATALILACTPLPPKGIQGYSMLWILPPSEKNPNDIRLGVSSREFTPTEYRLQLLVDGQISQEWVSLRLVPGEEWEVSTSPPTDFSPRTVEAILFRLDNPNVIYRRVTLWLGN